MYRSGGATSSGGLSIRLWALSLAVAAAGLVAGSGSVWARTASPDAAAAPVALAGLPEPARRTHRLILQGGPFPHAKDGVTFFNRERLLPPRPRGDYREYTVATPGVPHRGARRIVCSGRVPTVPDACFYTDNHYASFRRIVP